jgi:hypothetical protein
MGICSPCHGPVAQRGLCWVVCHGGHHGSVTTGLVNISVVDFLFSRRLAENSCSSVCAPAMCRLFCALLLPMCASLSVLLCVFAVLPADIQLQLQL